MRGYLIALSMFFISSAFPSRYDPVIPEREREKVEVFKREIFLNVKDMPLNRFVVYLAGITGTRIVLLEKDAKEPVSFTGKTTLEKLLDVILPPLGYWWERDGEVIKISRYVTRVWKIDVPLLVKELSFTSQRSEGISYRLSYREEIKQAVEGLLKAFTGQGERVVYDPYTGILTFYGSVRTARALEPIVEKLSEVLKQTIKLRIEIIALRLRKENESGINLSAILREGVPVRATLSSAGISPFSFGFTTSSFEGFISALERFGEVKSVDTKEFNVVSGLPVVYSVGGKVTYLKRVAIAYLQTYAGTTTAIPSVNIETGEETDGTDFVLIPKKLDDGRLSLEVMFSQKRIEAIEEKSFEVQDQTTTLQLPQVSYSNFHTTSVLEEGEELVLVSSVMDLKRDEREGIPFLIRIPGLRYLFGKNTELSDKVQFIVRVRYEGRTVSGNFLER